MERGEILSSWVSAPNVLSEDSRGDVSCVRNNCRSFLYSAGSRRSTRREAELPEIHSGLKYQRASLHALLPLVIAIFATKHRFVFAQELLSQQTVMSGLHAVAIMIIDKQCWAREHASLCTIQISRHPVRITIIYTSATRHANALSAHYWALQVA